MVKKEWIEKGYVDEPVDEALDLKAEIKKLAALAVRTVPAIAEGLEKLRSRVLIFCYQLSHIRSGKAHIQKSLAVWKPELERYTGLVQQIKEKSKERKALVAEKKELPIYHVKRHKTLAVRIAELTEDLEELRSEKALLLQKFEYAEDAGAEAFRKDIATMEAGLKKLEAQEQKYSAELDKALDEYAELKAQAADFDSVELYKARQVLRPAQEKAAEQQLEDALQKKPSFSLLLNAKQETSRLLKEDTEERQVRQMCDSEDHVEDAEERPCHQKGEHSADEPGQHGLDGAEPRHADVPDGVEDDRHEDGRQREHADEQPLLRAPRQHVVILCFCHIQSSNVAGRAIA